MRKALAYILLFLFLVPQANLKAHFHICHGNIINFKVWGNAKVCDHHKTNISLSNCSNQTINHKGCCNDLRILWNNTSNPYHKVENNHINAGSLNFNLNEKHFADHFEVDNEDIKLNLQTRPPPSKVEMIIFLQSFLI